MKRRHTPINWFILSIAGLPLVVIISLFWASSTISALLAYRSPISTTPPSPGEILGKPITHKVVVVLIDALRYDTSIDPEVMPFLNELRRESAMAIMESRPPSFSAPGWATILTGAWPDLNDSQVFNPPDSSSVRVFTQDDIFSAADRSELCTAVSGYSWFKQMLAQSGVDFIFTTSGEDDKADQSVVEAVLPWLSQDCQLVLIHLDQVDYAGHHEGGPQSESWQAAASRTDSLLQVITGEIDLSTDTLIVLSDHGQIDRGGHGGTEAVTLTEPFIAVGAGIIPGVFPNIHMADIAPTIATLLGTNLPASSQGRPLIEMLNLPEENIETIKNSFRIQQEQLYLVYANSIGQASSQLDPGASAQEALEKIRMRRLATERVWRNMIAALVVITPAYMLYLRRNKTMLWYICAGILYLMIFNVRYLLLDHRTYSVSSISGQKEFIVYTAVTTSISLLLAWLLPMFGGHGYKCAPRAAAIATLKVVWFTLYLLAIPVMINFAMNGIVVTWTLPEFRVQFHGLFALIQSIFVACFGLLLTAIAALFAKHFPREKHSVLNK